jgi:hypothetical protein
MEEEATVQRQILEEEFVPTAQSTKNIRGRHMSPLSQGNLLSGNSTNKKYKLVKQRGSLDMQIADRVLKILSPGKCMFDDGILDDSTFIQTSMAKGVLPGMTGVGAQSS